jgi:hypothetical protein
MRNKRSLSETLIDMVDGVAFNPPGLGLRVTSIEMTLPVDVAIESEAGEPVFLADVPQFVYRTAFDLAPSHLTVVWTERGTP